MPPIPYVFGIPNQHKEHTAIRNNIGPARAWRAPNHPQAAVISMGALDDLAAKLNMDPLDLWLKNLEIAGPRRHGNAAGGSEAHGGVDRYSFLHGAETRSIA